MKLAIYCLPKKNRKKLVIYLTIDQFNFLFSWTITILSDEKKLPKVKSCKYYHFEWWKSKKLKTYLFTVIFTKWFAWLPLQRNFEGFGMAVLKPFLQSPKPCGIPSLFISKSQISTIITPKTSSVSVSVATSDRYPSLKRSCSTRNSTPSTESDTSSTGVFIKGTHTHL